MALLPTSKGVLVVMSATTFQVLFNPRGFFAERVKHEESLKVPALIVLAVGIIGAVSAVMVSNLTVAILPAEVQALGPVILIFSALAALVGTFIVWALVAALFYVVSIALKGEGSFQQTLAFVGYGYLPQVFGGIVASVFYYLWMTSVRIPSVTDPNQIAGLLEDLLADPLLQMATVVSLLFLLWSANIWVFGVMYARNLSTRDAALTVGIPVGLYLIYTFVNIFGWLS
jgi:hypothetical protein